jgi:Poly(ADP-ribose) polymerase catalytic domain
MSDPYSLHRPIFEAQKHQFVQEAKRILLEAAKERPSLAKTGKYADAIEMNDRIVEVEMSRMEVEIEKLFAMIEMKSKLERPLKYREENNLLPGLVQTLKDEHDEALRKSMDDKRFSESIVYCHTEKERNVETRNFARMVRTEFQLQADNAKTMASARKIKADMAKKEAEEKLANAIKAKEATKQLVEQQEEHRVAERATASNQSPDDVAAKMARDMVSSGTIDLIQLAEVAAEYGKYVWVQLHEKEFNFFEDEHSWDDDIPPQLVEYESGPTIPYDETFWTIIEADFLAWQAGAGSQYASFEVTTKASIVDEQQQQQQQQQPVYTIFTVNLETMRLRNKDTGCEHGIRRIAVQDPSEKSILAELRWKALNEAEGAFTEAVAAYRKAEQEYYKAIQLVEEVEDYFYLHVMNRLPSDLPSIAVGHEQIPMGWDPMNDLLYMEIRLRAGQPEYDTVAKYFSKTSRNKILSITRIQNVPLWFLYEQTRKIIKRSRLNKNQANEEYLLHGCKVGGSLEKILVGGFDTSFNTRSPKGVWLSTNSRYSAKSYCYECRIRGTKTILLVRTVLGYIGHIHGVSPLSHVNGVTVDSYHCGRTSAGHVRRDDQVGGGTDNRYLVSSINQVYPAYVLEFESFTAAAASAKWTSSTAVVIPAAVRPSLVAPPAVPAAIVPAALAPSTVPAAAPESTAAARTTATTFLLSSRNAFKSAMRRRLSLAQVPAFAASTGPAPGAAPAPAVAAATSSPAPPAAAAAAAAPAAATDADAAVPPSPAAATAAAAASAAVTVAVVAATAPAQPDRQQELQQRRLQLLQ